MISDYCHISGKIKLNFIKIKKKFYQDFKLSVTKVHRVIKKKAVRINKNVRHQVDLTAIFSRDQRFRSVQAHLKFYTSTIIIF